MKSQFNGKCVACKRPLPAGTEIVYRRGVGAFCLECSMKEQGPTVDMVVEAQTLGFLPHESAMNVNWKER